MNHLKILPDPHLRDYISGYVLINVNMNMNGDGFTGLKPLWAIEEMHLYFVLNKRENPYIASDDGRITNLDINKPYLKGLNRNSLGHVLNRNSLGHVVASESGKILCVKFAPTGFYTLFGIPMALLKNTLCIAETVLSQRFDELDERLVLAATPDDIKRILDSFFIRQLLRSKISKLQPNIAKAYQLIKRNNYTVQQVAEKVCMSVRNLELQFETQIGMTPMFVKRLANFYNAINLKTNHPHLTWTQIAYQCGYYDQNHLIKEFKTFTNAAPNTSFKDVPRLEEQIFDPS